MVGVYIFMGTMMLFLPVFDRMIVKSIRVSFAIFFIAYGAFRLVRIINRKRNRQDEPNNAYYEKD
jgi:hypothetical protein